MAPSAWTHVRAALLLVVIVVQLLAAAPLPRSVKRSSFEEPVAREELGQISQVLSRIGITASHDQLADLFTATGTPMAALRGTVMAPFKEPLRWTGTGQSWGLFTYPDTFPHRLVVDARPADGAWRTLYAGLDPDRTWKVDLLTYRRVRGVYDGNTTKAGASWDNLSRWIADRAFEDHADVDEVRVYFQRFHTVLPGRPPDPEVVTRHSRTYHREAR